MFVLYAELHNSVEMKGIWYKCITAYTMETTRGKVLNGKTVGGDEKNTVHIGAYLDTKFHSYFRRETDA